MTQVGKPPKAKILRRGVSLIVVPSPLKLIPYMSTLFIIGEEEKLRAMISAARNVSRDYKLPGRETV